MSRRLIGVAVIALVFVVAIAISSTRSRKAAGQPEAVPVAGAPAVGTCLTQSVSGVDAITSQANQPIFPSVAVGDCSGPHHGEVVAVVDHRFAIPVDASTVLDPYEKWCSPALDDWTGRTSDPFEPDWVLEYQATRQVSIVFIGPDQRQLAAGQLWVACIAVPQVTGAYQGTSSSYERSIRNGFARLPAPPGLSSCWEQPQDTYDASQSTDCASGHRAEVVGHKFLTKTTSSASPESVGQERSCAQFAASVTGMADPTAGGRPTVGVQVAEPVDADPGRSIDAWCVISPSAATGYLFGSLLGLGNAPVPPR